MCPFILSRQCFDSSLHIKEVFVVLCERSLTINDCVECITSVHFCLPPGGGKSHSLTGGGGGGRGV